MTGCGVTILLQTESGNFFHFCSDKRNEILVNKIIAECSSEKASSFSLKKGSVNGENLHKSPMDNFAEKHANELRQESDVQLLKWTDENLEEHQIESKYTTKESQYSSETLPASKSNNDYLSYSSETHQSNFANDNRSTSIPSLSEPIQHAPQYHSDNSQSTNLKDDNYNSGIIPGIQQSMPFSYDRLSVFPNNQISYNPVMINSGRIVNQAYGSQVLNYPMNVASSIPSGHQMNQIQNPTQVSYMGHNNHENALHHQSQMAYLPSPMSHTSNVSIPSHLGTSQGSYLSDPLPSNSQTFLSKRRREYEENFPSKKFVSQFNDPSLIMNSYPSSQNYSQPHSVAMNVRNPNGQISDIGTHTSLRNGYQIQ